MLSVRKKGELPRIARIFTNFHELKGGVCHELHEFSRIKRGSCHELHEFSRIKGGSCHELHEFSRIKGGIRLVGDGMGI